MLSSLVYEFRCTQGCVPVSYVGSTKRHLYQRVAEHAGRSARTGKTLCSSNYSPIFEHSVQCTCSVDLSNFSVLGSTAHDFDLRLLESLFIYKKA
jgi:hypothetical protein